MNFIHFNIHKCFFTPYNDLRSKFVENKKKLKASNYKEIFLFALSLIRIGLVGKVFANGPGDMGSIPDRVIPKTLKIVLNASLLNTQQYKVRIKGKVV